MNKEEKIELFKNLWYGRNPVHDNNADTGEDMFWGTAMLVAEEFVRARLDESEDEIERRTKSNVESLRTDFGDWYFGIKNQIGSPPLAMQIFYWFDKKIGLFNQLTSKTPDFWVIDESKGARPHSESEKQLLQEATQIIKDKDKQVEKLKNLLRFDKCPELLIENPDILLKSAKPTDQDIQWAKDAIERFESCENKIFDEIKVIGERDAWKQGHETGLKEIQRLKGLLHEVCVRANIIFPETEEALDWFDEQFKRQHDLLLNISATLGLGEIDEIG